MPFKIRIKQESIFYSVTWLRWILALIVGIALSVNRKYIALSLFLLASFVGFLENAISRKYPSLLRKVIDFFADKLLINITSLVFVIKGIIPWWVFAIILARDLFTLAIGTYLLVNDLMKDFKPTFLGKVSYFLQIVAFMQIIFSGKVDWILMGSAIVLTIISGAYALFKSEFRLSRKKLGLGSGQFRILGMLKLADYVTLLNVALGLASIVFSISNRFGPAAIVLLICVLFDFLDGKIAVMMKQQNNFGKELDSLADTVSFGVAPAIFGFSMVQFYSDRNSALIFGGIAFMIFLFCGILRLARYNIMEFKGAYVGMPITLNGILIPAAYFLKMPVWAYPYVYLLLGIFMISTIKIKKL
jgi:CDP-diacylglycerol---serine O-phosphatidyltransferase